MFLFIRQRKRLPLREQVLLQCNIVWSRPAIFVALFTLAVLCFSCRTWSTLCGCLTYSFKKKKKKTCKVSVYFLFLFIQHEALVDRWLVLKGTSILKTCSVSTGRRYPESRHKDFALGLPFDLIFSLESDFCQQRVAEQNAVECHSSWPIGYPGLVDPRPGATWAHNFPARYWRGDVCNMGMLGHLSLLHAASPANIRYWRK